MVGRSNDGKLIALRCNACGERSEVAPENERATADQVTAELEAILAVGKALTCLDDAAGRKRVLHWALERFNGGDTAALPAESQAATIVPFPDQTLRVDNLTDLFTALPCSVAQRESAGPDDRLEDLFDEPTVMDREADVQAARIECASDPDRFDDDVLEQPWLPAIDEVVPVAPRESASAREPLPDDVIEQPWASRSEDVSPAARQDLALDALMRDFVNDFRQLAMACQSA